MGLRRLGIGDGDGQETLRVRRVFQLFITWPMWLCAGLAAGAARGREAERLASGCGAKSQCSAWSSWLPLL
jgi:hypothetical protein